MSKWQERVSSHAAITNLSSLGNLLEDVSQLDDISSESLDDLERLREIQRYSNNAIEGLDPALIPPAILNKLAEPIQNIVNEVSAYKADKNAGHLANANNHADGLLTFVFQLPTPTPAVQLEGMRETVSSFRRSAGQFMASIERQKDEVATGLGSIKARVDEVVAEVSSQKGRLDSAISEYQQQFSQAENIRREEFIKAQGENSDQVKENLKKYDEELHAALGNVEAKIESLIARDEKKLQALISSTDERAEAHIGQLEQFRDQAEELLQVIGSTGMAGEFQKAATSARRTVWFWQAIALISMLGLIIFAILAYKSTGKEVIDWAHIGTRIFVAVSFGVLGVFAVRQTDRYHDSELRNRRYQLELSSIDPYLAGLPDDVRNEVKVRLADRLFGNAGTLASKPTKDAGGNSLDVVKMALETVHDMIKANAR